MYVCFVVLRCLVLNCFNSVNVVWFRDGQFVLVVDGLYLFTCLVQMISIVAEGQFGAMVDCF